MALNSVQTIADAFNNGQGKFATWRKSPTQTTSGNFWFDLSMSPGNPVPNYYIGIPNQFTKLSQSTDYGIPHGGNVGQLGYSKFLKEFTVLNVTAAATPLPMLLCDYAGFYPFVDESNPSLQVMDNSLWNTSVREILPNTATLGSELVTNGALGAITTTTGWTAIQNCTLSNSGSNALVVTATAGSAYAGYYATGLTPGQLYRCEYQVGGYSSAAGNGNIYAGSVTGAGKNDLFGLGTTTGVNSFYFGASYAANFNNFLGVTRSFIFTATSSTMNFQVYFNGSNGDTVTLNYLSLKSVTRAYPLWQNDGLQIMPVVVAAHSGSPVYAIQYTNQDGIPNRWTPFITGSSAQSVNGTILVSPTQGNYQSSPILSLQPGDVGVRSIDGVIFTTTDVGLVTFVLVDIIENTNLRTIDAPAERAILTDFCDLPQIADDAYLNLICLTNGSISGSAFHGTIQTIWG